MVTNQTGTDAGPPVGDAPASTIDLPWGRSSFEPTFTIRSEWGFETGDQTCVTRFGKAAVSLRVDGDDRDALPRYVRLLLSAGTETLGGFMGETIRKGRTDIGWRADLRIDPGTGQVIGEPGIHMQDSGAAREQKGIFSFAPTVEDPDLRAEIEREVLALAASWESTLPGYVGSFYARALNEYGEDRDENRANAEARAREYAAQRDEARALAQAALDGSAIHGNAGASA